MGPRTAERLRAHGLASVGDLLRHLPRTYDDLRRLTPIAALGSVAPGRTVLVRGTIARVRVFPHRLLDLFVDQDGARLRARWFRPPRGMEKGFIKGASVALAGPVRPIATGDPAGGFELVQPSVHRDAPGQAAAGADGLGVRPRYPAVQGVSGRVLEKIIAAAVDRHAGQAPEALDAEARARLGLPAVSAALRAVHARAPCWSDEEVAALAVSRSPAHRRLAFEELLLVQLGLAVERREASTRPARMCTTAVAETRAAVRAALPFTLTAAQERAIDEIARDLAAARPMQRLLVGDVGSGKTVVAFAAAALAAAAGGQTILMAPTELLVDQHLRSMGALAASLSLAVARFTAALPRAERAATLARCRAGEVQILIGTQAVLDARPDFPDLRLAIVDEQHRFGVSQRARLRTPGPGAGALGAPPVADAGAGVGCVPHLLVMSATPIPRSLALTLYGDLDATFLRESPPGRRPVATEIFAGADRRRAAYARLQETVREGRQAYVVCPVREVAARAGAVTAVKRAAELRRQLGPTGIRVGLLHGDLDSQDQEALLRAYAGGAIDVLVATTVIELGIDVPNAAVMLIEDADRFGLAQLHQLRGRVGRGEFAGACLLCVAQDVAPGGDAFRRLIELVASHDGFRIAEADLAQRGPGELFGVRQAGAARLQYGVLADHVDLLEQARAEAQRIVAADPRLQDPQHRDLRAAVDARRTATAVFAEESG
ncbi:MAG TPA: ATP-dependent DNA helicase RecG [Polyangia bacterium]|nr:ATP-dependent DNA helicase RecG [Polyangia bacterium]